VTRDSKRLFDAVLTACVLFIVVGTFYILTGCTVKGFQYIPDGLSTPQAMRAASATARAEADALDAMANQSDAITERAFTFLQGSAEALGAPTILGTLLGLGGGLMIPAPGSRKREKELVEAVKK
tara:strand:+ start:1277 stop:1651 length:375 start_codon:yes stop_codon:yes gene_type:complete